jgi:hypothetical protein
MRDPPVAQRREVHHHRVRTGHVVNRQHGIPLVAHGARQEDSRHVSRQVLVQRSRVEMWRHDDHPIDAPAHGTHGGFELRSGTVSAREQQMVPPRLGRAVHPPDELGKELPVEIGEEHADRVGAGGDERASATVWHVTQRGRDLSDSLGDGLADRAAAVQHARHGSH